MSDAPMPAVGTLTDRVALKRRVTTTEDEGGALVTYAPLATVWGRVRAVGARPAVDADGRGVTLTHSVVLRFRTDVAPGDRISHRGVDLDVVAASDLNGRRVYLSCQCTARMVTG